MFNYITLYFKDSRPSGETKNSNEQMKVQRGGGGGGNGRGISERRFVKALQQYIMDGAPNMPAEKAKESAQRTWNNLVDYGDRLQLVDKVPAGYSKQYGFHGGALYRESVSRFAKKGEDVRFVAVLAPEFSKLLYRRRK